MLEVRKMSGAFLEQLAGCPGLFLRSAPCPQGQHRGSIPTSIPQPPLREGDPVHQLQLRKEGSVECFSPGRP